MSNLAFKYNDRVVNTVKPVLKWAGGKSQLLSRLNELLPPKLKVNAIHRAICWWWCYVFQSLQNV